MSVYTCTKGTPGSVGMAYLKLISKTVTGMGVVPGIAVCGTVDWATQTPTSGFAFATRPQSLTGKWQYMASGADQGFIAVALTKWNMNTMMHDTIAYAYHALAGMAMSWANFNIPLSYMNGDDPDSCLIVFSASRANNVAAVANSYLYADEIAFSGLVAGIKNNPSIPNISVTPNPATDVLTMDLSALKEKYLSVNVFDIQGKLVKSFEQVEVNSHFSIDIADLQKGNYVLKLSTVTGTITKNFIKQ